MTRSGFASLWMMLSLSVVGSAYASDVVQRWDFTTDGDTQGWTLNEQGKDLTAANGILRFEITAADVNITSPPLALPLDGCAVRVRMRCSKPGSTQVYWTHNDYPAFGEQCVMTRFTAARRTDTDDGFITERFDIGLPKDADKTLTSFRIDPYNGHREGTVEIDMIELIRLPAIYDYRLSPSKLHVDVDKPVDITASATHIGGRVEKASYTINWDGDRDRLPREEEESKLVNNGASAVSRQTYWFDRAGVHTVWAELYKQSDSEAVFGETHSVRTQVIVGKGARLALTPLLQTNRYRLDAVPFSDNRKIGDKDNYGAIRWQVRVGPDEWRDAGWLSPLSRMTTDMVEGTQLDRWDLPVAMIESQDDQQVTLIGFFMGHGEGYTKLQFKRIERSGLEAIEVTTTLEKPIEGARLAEFSGPVLRVEPREAAKVLDRYALFGGLEFLSPGWKSSSPDAVGQQFADRWTPHPFKVSLPVMAIEADGITSAMMWQPNQKWDGKHTTPNATFASPNFIDEQANHLMALSVPSVPDWCNENEQVARRLYETTNEPITLRYVLYAEKDLPVAMTAKRWYQLFDAPPPPPAVHDDKQTAEIIAKNFGETMYWENENGWRQHWYFPINKTTHFVPFMAAELIGHAATTANDQYIKHTGITDRTIIDTMTPLASRFGDRQHVAQLMRTMQPDGTWPFHMSDAARKLTLEVSKGQFDTLGEEGSTSLGTCVQPALRILQYAQFTGDDEAFQSGIKALEAMRQFRVPRGAQVWEVHQQTPDIRAAALAVEAYHIGYQITGDNRWLDEANYWAWAGVPFIYSWHVPIEKRQGQFVSARGRDEEGAYAIELSEPFENPHRQVTPYGTLPVMGTSCYVVNWFGVLVQWCGMEWAWKVIELDADRSDPLLRFIADGVVASGLQQMIDRDPWTGLYPDWWNLEANIASGSLINAMLPMRCLQAQGRMPNYSLPWSRVLHKDNLRWHVSGWGEVVRLDPPTNIETWTAEVRFIPGQPNELVIAGVDKPRRITIDRQLLPLQPAPPGDMSDAETNWGYLPRHRALLIRFAQHQANAEIKVAW